MKIFYLRTSTLTATPHRRSRSAGATSRSGSHHGNPSTPVVSISEYSWTSASTMDAHSSRRGRGMWPSAGHSNGVILDGVAVGAGWPWRPRHRRGCPDCDRRALKPRAGHFLLGPRTTRRDRARSAGGAGPPLPSTMTRPRRTVRPTALGWSAPSRLNVKCPRNAPESPKWTIWTGVKGGRLGEDALHCRQPDAAAT